VLSRGSRADGTNLCIEFHFDREAGFHIRAGNNHRGFVLFTENTQPGEPKSNIPQDIKSVEIERKAIAMGCSLEIQKRDIVECCVKRMA
jgi:hypothetical protein